MFAKLFVFFSVLFLGACSSSSHLNYEIGVDPSWRPLDFQEKQKNILGFSTELLTKISAKEHLSISLLNTNWDSLFDGLKSKKYQAVLSSLYPYNFNKELYNFSDPFLEIGPVLVLPLQSPKLSLKDLSGKAVGILEGSPDVLLLEKDPSILIRNYVSAPVALNALVSGEIEAALIPILTASSYVDHIYFKKLKIGSPPLTDEGL